MTAAVVVHDGWDATAELLADAGRRLGADVVELDLRIDRLGVRIGPGGAEVRHGGRELRPDVVINRSSVTGLGLASAPMLDRQRPHGWHDRHIAARQEQGVLLGAFDAWERAGAALLNATTAEDLALMPNAVTERLVRAGVGVTRREDIDVVEILVAGGRGIAHRLGTNPTGAHLRTALAVAGHAGFELGTVRVRTGIEHAAVSGWDHRPDLTSWPRAERIALAVWSTMVQLDPDALTDPPPRFFVDEL